MQNIDSVTMDKFIAEVKAQLEKMGIVVADEAIYTSTMLKDSKIAVLACYLPGKALVFGVNISSWRSMKFTITGQLKEGWKKAINHDPSFLFPKVERKFVEQEIAVGREFSINNYVDDRIAKDEQIRRGISFFRGFILNYGDILETKFTKRMRLWVVPVNCDQFFEVSREKGMEAALNHFEGIIISKFPEDFFPANELNSMSA